MSESRLQEREVHLSAQVTRMPIWSGRYQVRAHRLSNRRGLLPLRTSLG